ncbi:MAG: toprim domain-containing protein [Pseudomonadota bacterium]
MSQHPSKYTEENIKVYKGLEGVRKNVGMYIGGANTDGLHHLVREIIANSFDEFSAGFGSKITITLHKDDSVTVEDEGRGIPVGIHPQEKKSTLEVLMTTLHSGGKFNSGDGNPYKSSGGIHGLGGAIVNALSKIMQITVFRDGKEHYLEFQNGVPQKSIQVVRNIAKNKTGTKIRFQPCPTIFKEHTFDWNIIYQYLQELSFLNAIEIHMISEITNKKHIFTKELNIKDYVLHINSPNNTQINKTIHFFEEKNNISIEIALLWNNQYTEKIYCFTNNIRQKDGGEHLAGLRIGLTKSLLKYMKDKTKINNIKGEDIREGLTCILSLKMERPEFSSQTKDKLVSDNIRAFISKATYEHIYNYLLENPHAAKAIMDKILQASQAREAAQKARNLTRRKDPLDIGITLPGKLADCSEKDASICELLIVEGNSAGGTAKQGRNRETQAVLPLRGKIVNTHSHDLSKAVGFEQITNLITALGCGIGDNFNIEKLRYHKIIIMTDADVDGAHIRTLILTFFYRFMYPLIENGHLYIAQPPLYKIVKKKYEKYIKNDIELQKELLNSINQNNNITLSVSTREKLNGIMQIQQLLQNLTAIEKNLIINLILDQTISNQHIPKFDHDDTIYINDKNYIKEGYFYYKIYENEVYNINQETYKKICNIIDQYNILTKDNDLQHANYFELFNHLIEETKKTINIQRYKGLGEMNASQLAESTLDPKKRNLLAVSDDNVEFTSKRFQIFMGDDTFARKNEIMSLAYTQRDNNLL